MTLQERLRGAIKYDECNAVEVDHDTIDEAADALDAQEKRIKELKLILEAIRDSTHVSAVVLRGLAARELEKK